MKFIKSICLFTCLALMLNGCDSPSSEKKIGIIVPLEHKAINEIVAGFTETLQKKYSQPIKIKVANAQGDINIQRAIIQQMKNDNYDIIVPIGTTTTQMTLALIQDHAIVSLAAQYSQKDRDARKKCNVALVHDEISAEQQLQFIHTAYPNISKIVLIHSPQDKVFPEIEASISAGEKLGISIKPLMINSLNELYTVANAVSPDTQAIYILKDHMIVSGIATLELLAEKRSIPLITSDQGSVEDGSAFSIGVHEREIGEEGALLAEKILTGTIACTLPIVTMKNLTIFINKHSLTKEKQNIDPIVVAAKKLHYQIEYVNGG